MTVHNKWLEMSEPVRLDIYEIRHYLVRDGYFLEFSLYIPQFLPDGTFDEEELIDDWTGSLHSFVKSSGLVNDEENYKQQVGAF